MTIYIKLIHSETEASFITEKPFYIERDAHEYMRSWAESCSLLGLNAPKYILTYWK